MKTANHCDFRICKSFNPFFPDQICNSPYCLPNNSYNISSENLVFNQLIVPKLIFFFILITYLVNVFIDIVRRNSVLVTHGSYRVKLLL